MKWGRDGGRFAARWKATEACVPVKIQHPSILNLIRSVSSCNYLCTPKDRIDTLFQYLSSARFAFFFYTCGEFVRETFKALVEKVTIVCVDLFICLGIQTAQEWNIMPSHSAKKDQYVKCGNLKSEHCRQASDLGIFCQGRYCKWSSMCLHGNDYMLLLSP